MHDTPRPLCIAGMLGRHGDFHLSHIATHTRVQRR